MASIFDSILEECIQRIQQGATLEECLASYPEYAAELEPALRAGLELLAASSSFAPTPAAKAAAKQRFDIALEVRQRRREQSLSLLSRLFGGSRMGFATAALIGMQVDPGKVKDVADAMAALDEAHYVAITLGSFDIFAWVGLESPEQLGIFVRTKVHPIPGVRRTETFVNETIRKRTYGLVL